jgi:nucleoside-diphosphate-sugar epimerase
VNRTLRIAAVAAVGAGSLVAAASALGAATGSGATFPAVAYQKWCGESKVCSYTPKGSSGGIRDLTNKTVDWAGNPDAPHSFAFLPDLAAAYAALAETPSAWGKAWHMPALPPVTLREICDMALPDGAAPTRIRQTPSWLLRAIGLFQPAAGELVEMRYMFDQPFVIDHSAFDEKIGAGSQGWDRALTETVAWWNRRMQKAA